MVAKDGRGWQASNGVGGSASRCVASTIGAPNLLEPAGLDDTAGVVSSRLEDKTAGSFIDDVVADLAHALVAEDGRGWQGSNGVGGSAGRCVATSIGAPNLLVAIGLDDCVSSIDDVVADLTNALVAVVDDAARRVLVDDAGNHAGALLLDDLLVLVNDVDGLGHLGDPLDGLGHLGYRHLLSDDLRHGMCEIKLEKSWEAVV